MGNRYGVIGVRVAVHVRYFFPFWVILNAIHEALKKHYLAEGQGLLTKVVTQGGKLDFGIEKDLWCEDSASCYDKCLGSNLVVFLVKQVSHHGLANLLDTSFGACVDELSTLPHFLQVENLI